MVTAPRSSLCRVLLSAASNRDSKSHSITGTWRRRHTIRLEGMGVMLCWQGWYLAQYGLLCLQPASALQRVFMGFLLHRCSTLKLSKAVRQRCRYCQHTVPILLCMHPMLYFCMPCRDVQREHALAEKRNPQPPRVVMLLPLSQVCFFPFADTITSTSSPSCFVEQPSVMVTLSVNATHIGLTGTHVHTLHGIKAPAILHRSSLLKHCSVLIHALLHHLSTADRPVCYGWAVCWSRSLLFCCTVLITCMKSDGCLAGGGCGPPVDPAGSCQWPACIQYQSKWL